jgi:hypothetical protein
MTKSIDILVKAKDLPRTPTIREVFDRGYLPAASERPTSVRADVTTSRPLGGLLLATNRER